MADKTLDELIEAARARVARMSEDEIAAMLDKQAESFVYGNLAIDNPHVTRDMVIEAARKHRAEREAQRG